MSSVPKPDLNKLLFRCEEELRNKMDELNRWDFESVDEWSFEQTSGQLVLSRCDGVEFIAPAQIVGSYNDDLGTWMWAWANKSVNDSLKRDSLAVQEFGLRHKFKDLTTPCVEMYDSDAVQMTALAAHLTGAWGFYRGMADPSRDDWLLKGLLGEAEAQADDETIAPDVYFTFRNVVMRRADGSEEQLQFQPDPVYGLNEGEQFSDQEIARVVHAYTAAVNAWSSRCLERLELVKRGEMDYDDFEAGAFQERHEIFERFCSTSRGRPANTLVFRTGDGAQEVVRLTRYPDGTVTAIERSSDDGGDCTAFRLLQEDGCYRIYRKYRVYDDGSRKLQFGDDDL